MIYTFSLLMLFTLLSPPQSVVYLDYNMLLSGNYIDYSFSLTPSIIQLTPDADLTSHLEFNANISITQIYKSDVMNYRVPTLLKSSRLFSHDNSMLQVAYNIYFAILNNANYQTPEGLFEFLSKNGIIAHKVYLMVVPKNPLMKEKISDLNQIKYVVGALIDYDNFKFLVIPYSSIDNFNQYLYIPVGIDSDSTNFFEYRDIQGETLNLPASAEFKVQSITMPSSETVLTPTITVEVSGSQYYLHVKNPNTGYVPLTVSDRFKRVFDTVILPPGESVIPIWFSPSRFFLWNGVTYRELRGVQSEVLHNILSPMRTVYYSGETVVINDKILPDDASAVTVFDVTSQKIISGVKINYETHQITFTAPEVPLFEEDAIQITEQINSTQYTTFVFVKPPIYLTKLNYDTQNGVLDVAFSDNPLNPNYRNVVGTLSIQISVNGQPFYTQDISMFNMKQSMEFQVGTPSLMVGTNRITVTLINQLPNGRTTKFSKSILLDVTPQDYVRGVITNVQGGDEKKHIVYDNGKIILKVLLNTLNYGGYESDVKVFVNGKVAYENAVSGTATITVTPPAGYDYVELTVVVDGYPVFTKVYLVEKPPFSSSLKSNLWFFIIIIGIFVMGYWRYRKIYPEKQIVKEDSPKLLAMKFARMWYYHVYRRVGAGDVRLIHISLDPVRRYYLAVWYSPSLKVAYAQIVPESNPTVEYDGFILDPLSAEKMIEMLNYTPSADIVLNVHKQITASENVKGAQEITKLETQKEAKTLDEEAETKDNEDFAIGGDDDFDFGDSEEDENTDFGDLFADEDEGNGDEDDFGF